LWLQQNRTTGFGLLFKEAGKVKSDQTKKKNYKKEDNHCNNELA
jgi:hypothetical protein